jgi:hypothetical protein
MADFEPYRADPGTRFGYTDADGSQREIVADERGLVVATDDAGEQVLAGFDLPRGHVTEKDRAAGSATVRKLTADDAGKGA